MSFTGENHTVDTYVSLEGGREVMTQFGEALSAIGAPAHTVREWATGAAWPVPSVLTPEDIPELTSTWIKCAVFFHSDDLCVWTGDNIAYLPDAVPLLWSVVAFARIGSNRGVFLEHEGQNPAGWQLEYRRDLASRWR